MKRLLFGMLCVSAMGCNRSSPSVSNANSTSEQPTTVTVQRPITTTAERPAAANEPVDRTNTGINVRDRDSAAKTPFDQNENKADLAISADIRKQVVGEKMSLNAHNVKIITQDGKVTLRGPVNTEQEKQKIEAIALAVAGANKVDSQLEVKNE